MDIGVYAKLITYYEQTLVHGSTGSRRTQTQVMQEV